MDNHYQNKYEEFIENIQTLMYTFEVTLPCGYSTFVTIYKNQTTLELYSNIINHFGNLQVKKLFFTTSENERIYIPISNQKMCDFVFTYTSCNPIKLTSIYKLPKPVVYRLYLEGRCSETQCSTNHYHS